MESGVTGVLINLLSLALLLYVLYLFGGLTSDVKQIRKLLEKHLEEDRSEE